MLLGNEKRHIKRTRIKNFRGVSEGVREGGFGARLLYERESGRGSGEGGFGGPTSFCWCRFFFCKIQRIKNSKGRGGLRALGGGSKVQSRQSVGCRERKKKT